MLTIGASSGRVASDHLTSWRQSDGKSVRPITIALFGGMLGHFYFKSAARKKESHQTGVK
jgi:hypothetical protein